MLANIAVGLPVLSWEIRYATNKTGSLHVDCGGVGQCRDCWLIHRVPERGGGAVDSVGPYVTSCGVCAIDDDGPAGLGDSPSKDIRDRRSRFDPSQRIAIVGCSAFGGELSLFSRWDGSGPSVGGLSGNRFGFGKRREGGERKCKGEELKHLERGVL